MIIYHVNNEHQPPGWANLIHVNFMFLLLNNVFCQPKFCSHIIGPDLTSSYRFTRYQYHVLRMSVTRRQGHKPFFHEAIGRFVT